MCFWPFRRRWPVVEMFKDVKEKWHWRLRARNAEILASSEAYSSRAEAWTTANKLANLFRIRLED